jgi:hypothetical protein
MGNLIMHAREGGSCLRGGIFAGRSGARETVTLILAALAGFGKQEDFLVDFFSVLSQLLDKLVALLTFPLIVAPAELTVPALRGFKVGQLAEAFGFKADVLFGEEYFLVYFDIESHLHLCIGRPAATLLALTSVFLPPEKIPAGDAVLFRDLLGVDALQDLHDKLVTCLTAYSFSATVYFL